MTAYSNPRMSATVEDWPSGSRRVTAVFTIEQVPGKGERAVRVTTGAPKKLTYAPRMRIVDGDDGRTYIVALTSYGHISVHLGDMKHSREAVFERDAGYAELRALFD